MIEVMARAINNTWRDDFERGYNSIQAAEAALKALCGALPDPKEYFEADICYELYNQLKQWGEE